MKSIGAAELAQALGRADAPFLLDVREPEEVVDGRIDGSINIPMGDVENRLSEIPAGRDVVVICRSGRRSARVTDRLNALGYDRASNLDGGMEAWLAQLRR